jgi:hypothetical protein
VRAPGDPRISKLPRQLPVREPHLTGPQPPSELSGRPPICVFVADSKSKRPAVRLTVLLPRKTIGGHALKAALMRLLCLIWLTGPATDGHSDLETPYALTEG